MAFTPSKNQLYYLMPKHSQQEGMCLGVEDGGEGRVLQIQKIDPSPKKARGQRFAFEASGATHFINLLGYDDRCLNVKDASQANPADIVSYRKEDNVYHNQFQLLYAGDGYYRIMCFHSKKYFDVWEAKTAEGTPVYQYQASGTDNQLFKLVASGNQIVGKNATSFVEANELARTLSLAAISKIPEVGAGLSFVVGTFWEPENKLSALWTQMKAYVDERLAEYFKKAKLDELAKKLEGTMEKLAEIVVTDIKRGARLMTAIDAMIETRPSFKDNEVSETLPYLVALQTIIIGARHTVYHDYDLLFPKNPNGKKEAKDLLIKEIEKYTAEIEKQRGYLLDGRTDKVQFNAQLDELLYTSRFWPYLLPGAPFYKPETKQLAVTIDGGNYKTKTSFTSGTGRITGVKFYDYNAYGDLRGRFWGIEVFYDGVSKGIHGGNPAPSKYPPASSVVLAADEWICGVYGRKGLTDIIFTTNKGQISSGEDFFKPPGSNVSQRFFADLPDSMNARLTAISGECSQNGLSQLTFHWEFIK